jgi:DNA-binding beta-propeller fold protein YncE
MTLFFQKNFFSIIALLATVCSLLGCAVIAGKEDGEVSTLPLPNLQFVESLRSQESLRGESFKETEGNGGAAALQRPSGVYADQFRVYVTDTAQPARVLIFDRTDRTVSVLNVPAPSGGAQGKLFVPTGIAADLTGVIFVSDSQQGKVFGFDRNGKLLFVLGRPQIVNSENGLGDLMSPSGLAFDDANNRLYVADLHGQQVQVFNTSGAHLFEIGRTGRAGKSFKFPAAVALDRAGNVYVLDSLRLKVYVFNPDGAFQRSFSLKKGLTPDVSVKPSGLAVDSSGNVYVSDAVYNTVHIFDNAGGYLVSWGRGGKLFGDFWTPSGIFIDSHDYIYIADQTNSRIQVFQHVK